MQLRFHKKPFKVGNSHAVTIPNDYIENGHVDTDKEYNFTIEVP